MNKMSEDEATEKLKRLVARCKECKFATCENCEINWNEIQAIDTILALYKQEKEKNKELDKENERLKYLITESCKFIDKYTNELENDTQKIIEYREKYLEKRIKNNK